MYSSDWEQDNYWLERISGTGTEDFIKIYESTRWTSDANKTYENILDALLEVLDAEEAHIHLLDSEGNVFVRRASHEGSLDLPADVVSSWQVGVGRSKLLIADRKPQVLDYAHPHADDELPYDDKRFAICFSLATVDQVLGICTVIWYERKEWNQDDMDYFSIIGFIIGNAIDRLRVSERVSELAVLTERKRLGSEIHDNVVQLIHAVSLNAAAALESFDEGDSESLRRDLERMESNCNRTVKVFRDEMLSLRAPLSGERSSGLVESVRTALESYEKNWQIKTHLVLDVVNDPLVASVTSSLQLMRILNEALSNVLRHADATEASVRIYEDDAHLVMTICDNGHGFDVDEVTSNHWGIKIMRERSDSINGKFSIRSDASGTTITVDVPRIGRLV